MTYSARFLRCDSLTAELEGGLAPNNASDRGGETAFGISRRRYPKEDPWPPSRERAEYLRHRDYWAPCGCDELPELITRAVYDWAIHSGEGAPARALQRELGVTADGDIGPRTVAACAARCSTLELELELAESLMRARARLLADLVRGDPSQAEFLTGWLARLLAVGAAIRDAYLIALDSRPIVPLKGGDMTEIAPVAGGEGAAEPKPIIKARRVWAAVLAVLASVLPAAKALGLDLPEGLVESLDGTIQAIFGIAAAALALWSRLRPDPAPSAP